MAIQYMPYGTVTHVSSQNCYPYNLNGPSHRNFWNSHQELSSGMQTYCFQTKLNPFFTGAIKSHQINASAKKLIFSIRVIASKVSTVTEAWFLI
jgi:hypothetical protein